MSHRKLLLGVLLSLIGAASLAGIAAVLMPSSYINEDIIFTAVIVGLYGLGGLTLVAIAGTQRLLMRICVVALAVSMAVYLFGIWGDGLVNWSTMRSIVSWGTISLMLGLLLAHRMLVAPLRAPGTIALISKRTALISAGLLFLILTYGITRNGFGRFDEIIARIMFVDTIVLIASTIASGAIALFSPKPGEDEPGLLTGSIGVDLTCPRCQHPVHARSNREARCEGCRLKVRVEVEEPRCACGYLLYQLESDTCPECGKPINPDDRWQGAAPEPA